MNLSAMYNIISLFTRRNSFYLMLQYIPEIGGNFAELCNDRLHIRAQFDNAGANNNTKIIQP